MKYLEISEAAELLHESYHGAASDKLEQAIDIAGAQAYMLKNGVLLVPGTNELSDWLNFNLDFIQDEVLSVGFAIALGDSGAKWHAGFLEHAQLLYGFAKAWRPKFIVGHSLGAASAQILGKSLHIPTICFASPRPYQGGKAQIAGEGWVCNVCRRDDDACFVPSSLQGFRHVGSVYWLNPHGDTDSDKHSMPNYIEALTKPQPQTKLPKAWPHG